jgi:dihydropteroate synthase
MGILNLTVDSFYQASRVNSTKELLVRVEKMLVDGAAILDIGAQSTRPGSSRIPAEEEISRVLPAIESILNTFPEAIISIDSYHSSVVKAAVEAGAAMINDISGGNLDPEMFNTVASLKVPYVLMHMKGEPGTMQINPHYADIISEVVHYFSEKISQLRKLGVSDIILDPGFGFGKTTEHNLQLLRNLQELHLFGLPVLAGLSRKKTIQHILNVPVEETLNGTTAMNTMALMNGANILRVHDVKEAKQVIELYRAMRS